MKLIPIPNNNPKNQYEARITLYHGYSLEEELTIRLNGTEAATLFDKVCHFIKYTYDEETWRSDEKYLEDHVTAIAEALNVPEDDIPHWIDDICRRDKVYQQGTAVLKAYQVFFYDEHGTKFKVEFEGPYVTKQQKEPFKGFF